MENKENLIPIHHTEGEYGVVYIPGDFLAFKAFIDEHYANKTVELMGINGKNRWVVTREDGSKYVVRPEEVKLKVISDENNENSNRI